jgi:nucleoside-diphosphate-sugar epimerase
MAKVLILGAAGFIGSHLVRTHLDRGDEVVGIDNFCTGNIRNIESISHANWQFVEGDLVDPELRLPQSLDKIYHMASPASPPKYMSLARETMEVNTIGTQRLIDLASHTGARILFASTSETYGDPMVHPQPESYWGNVNPIGPRSVYDEAKRFGETLMAHAAREELADTVLIRIFNTYGPHMDPDDGRVVSTFIRQTLRREQLSVFGTGKQTRSFCYVDDLVKGITGTMDSEIHGPINLGNPNEFTLLELADVIGEVLNTPIELLHMPLPQDDPQQRQPDISYAKAELGWEPRIQLAEGISRTVEWMKNIV